MAKVSRLILSACASAFLLGLGSAAHAHLITPFICTPDGTADGFSRFGNSGGIVFNSIGTVEDGNSIAGFTLSDIDSFNVLGAGTLTFEVKGTVNLTNGPYVYVIGTDQNNTPIFAAASMKSAHVTGHFPGGWSGALGKGSFGIPSGTKVKLTEFVIQLFPGATPSSTEIAGMRVNGLSLVPVYTLKRECPGGTSP